MTKLVIENCEPELSEWLFLEYKHAAELWGSVVFTNVSSPTMAARLSPIGKVEKKPFHEVFAEERVIILDPKGREALKSRDFDDAEAVVIGGILGEATPKGRTTALITSRVKNARVRNLGEVQLTIDSAALVAKLVQLGLSLGEIEITREVELKLSENESILLPYGYVVLEDRLLLTPGLKEYLLRSHSKEPTP
jgi:ribosome biogenesis SPOUT family RNA methylase Rps3